MPTNPTPPRPPVRIPPLTKAPRPLFTTQDAAPPVSAVPRAAPELPAAEPPPSAPESLAQAQVPHAPWSRNPRPLFQPDAPAAEPVLADPPPSMEQPAETAPSALPEPEPLPAWRPLPAWTRAPKPLFDDAAAREPSPPGGGLGEAVHDLPAGAAPVADPHPDPLPEGEGDASEPLPSAPDPHPGPLAQAGEGEAPRPSLLQRYSLFPDRPQPLYAAASPPPVVAAPAIRPAASSAGATLVTGGTGFVGSAVARALIARGHRVRLLVRARGDRRNIQDLDAELVEGDLRDAASLAAAVAGCRYVVHVAADYRLWVPDPEAMRAANVDGTRALLLAARDAGVERIVYCSSVAALGLVGDGTPADEDTPVHPQHIIGAYKRSKYDAEQVARQLAAEGVPIVIVNPTAPVGPRDVKPTPTGRMILDAAAGRMPAYVPTGLNIVHVDDVAAGHVLALERGQVGEAYILGGEDLGMAHLLALVDDVMGRSDVRRRELSTGVLAPVALASEAKARVFGTEPRVTREMLAMADKQMFFSSAKARAELGYTSRPPRRAVLDAVQWFRAQGALR